MSIRSDLPADSDDLGSTGPTPGSGNRAAAAFVAVCAASAFLIRYFALPENGVINGDGVFYATFGSRLISGNLSGGISTYWSPLYSSLLGIASLFTQDLESSGRAVSLVAGSLLVVPTFILIRKFFGEASAYIGTVLVVSHPLLITSSGWVMTESLYVLIFTTAVVCGWLAFENGKPYMFLLTGLLYGLAYLTKPEFVGFVVLFSLLLVVWGVTQPSWRIPRVTSLGLIFLTGFGIFFLPYVVFIHQKTGNWTVSQKLVSNSTFNKPERGMLKLTEDGSTTMQDRIWWDDYEAKAYVSEGKLDAGDSSPSRQSDGSTTGDFFSKTFRNLSKELREYMRMLFPLSFIFVGAIGFISAPWNRVRAKKDVYLLSFVACTFIGYAATVTEVRYFYALIPILLGWVGLGCDNIGRFVAKHSLKRKWPVEVTPTLVQILLLLLLIASLTPLFFVEFKRQRIENVPYEEKAAGLWLRHNSDPHSIVMSPNAGIAFYAAATHIFLPDEDLQTIREYAARRGVTYIVLNERRLKNRQSVYASDYETIGNLTLVYDDYTWDGYNVKIYKIAE